MPNLALMLPIFGHGLAHLGRLRERKQRRVALAIGLLFSIGALSVERGSRASSGVYAAFLSRQLGVEGVRVLDEVELRSAGAGDEQTVTVRTVEPDYRIRVAPDSLQTRWAFSTATGLRSFGLISCRATAPATLELTSSTGEKATLRPVQPESWRRWRPSGVQGVEYRWLPSIERPRCRRPRRDADPR